MLCAGNVQIYQSFELNQIDAGIAHMQLNAQAIADWATDNRVKLRIRKIEIIIFGSLQYLTTSSKRAKPIAPIEINGVPFPSV